MRLKHNKKRNTAFLYESLVRELTKSIIKNDNNKKNKAVKMLKQHFSPESDLRKELSLYKSLYETKGVERRLAEKIIIETKIAHKELDRKNIFNEQTSLIKNMNVAFSSKVFNTFVPNFRNIATVYSIFNASVPANERVMLEERVLDNMSGSQDPSETKMKPVDDLVYKTFVSKFNEQYSDSLLKEQKELLTKYITSFSDNELEIKCFLNEEVSRIRAKLESLSKSNFVKSDDDLRENSKKILEMLEEFSDQKVSTEIVETVLRTQQLIHELENKEDDKD